jgi:DNA-3-methyladenine glycosylase I
LSWAIILRKRDHFLEAFDGLDPARMARYDRRRIAKLLKNPGIVRNRQKVAGAVASARAFVAMAEAGESFDAFLWAFVGGAPRRNARKTLRQIPAQTKESERMSAALVERGFRFVGPTICHAFMQAVGMVNDHLVTCFRHAEL